MKPESLIASAAINFGLAMVILSLFSILKKQPSNAPIYYARRLADESTQIHFDSFFSARRFLPSMSWISRAFRVPESQILQTSGLDALVVIRLFKFGIKFFVVCSVVGVAVLLPVNYNGQGAVIVPEDTMDTFNISNIKAGSDRLWVHFGCLWFLSLFALHLLYKEYDDILTKRIRQLSLIRHRPDQFTVLVREIPLCIDHGAIACSVDHFFSKYYPQDYHSYQILYNGKEVEELMRQAKSTTKKIEKLKEKSIRRLIMSRSSPVEKYEREKAKLSLQQEKLEELRHKIQRMQCESTLLQKELPVAFVTFKSRVGATLVAQSQQHSHPLNWITEMAPEPRDVSWRNLALPYRLLPLSRLGVYIAAMLLTIFFAVPVTGVQGIAKFEKLRKWFPLAMAIDIIPGLRSVVTGYLPSAILKLFIYLVPFAMWGMAKLSGCASKSTEEIRTCNMVFYFLVGNVFFLSLLSGSLIDQIGKSFTSPKDVPTRLAGAVSAQADFFLTYILTDGLSGFSLEILQPGLLIWDVLRSCCCNRANEKNPYLYSFPYFRVIPLVSMLMLIGMVYAVVSPLLLPFLIGYFCLGYLVFINQIEDVYDIVYETCGGYWPYIHHYIVIAVVLMQTTMIGIFLLKSKPAASIATLPLLALTLMFNEYCKIRFLPSFSNISVQNAMKNDELDIEDNELELNYENAKDAYSPPCLRPLDYMESGSSSRQPLVASS